MIIKDKDLEKKGDNLYRFFFIEKVVPLYFLNSEKISFLVIFTGGKILLYFTDISLYFTGKKAINNKKN